MEMTSRDRKALIVLGAVMLVALLLYVFVLHKGGSSSETAAPVTPPTTAPLSPAPLPTQAPTGKKPKLNHLEFSGLDPFVPLADTGVSTDTTTTTTTTPTTTTSPEPSPTPAPTTSPTPAPSPSPAA